ncbi:MAG TPA: S8 family serine peptidase, partial [Steroidobacteraceae bacterium]|nr:S8 family serine peptidase [Steroidobacteraceae bacterium]
TAPGRVKLLMSDNGLGASIDTFSTFSPTLQGHTNAAGAVAVGAALYFQSPACGTAPAVLEPYSSYGDDPVLFDTSGRALAAPVNRGKPDLTASDGVNDTFLGFQLANSTQAAPPWNADGRFTTSISQCQNNTQYPNFFGTSAAAPHAAAAAALLWQANPALSAAQVVKALKDTALPMAEGAQGAGAGFLQVNAALAALPTGAPALTVSPAEIAAGSPATLTWVSYDTTSCAASGDWSGAEATAGSVTVTPAAEGTLSYSLSCTGPNGTGPVSTVTLSVQSAAGHHGGGRIDAATLVFLAAVLLASRRRGVRGSSRSNSPARVETTA